MKEVLHQVLTKSILNKRNYSGLGYPAIVEEICNKNELVFNLDDEYNSWEVDWWANITTKSGDEYCEVSGSMYYGTISLNFDV